MTGMVGKIDEKRTRFSFECVLKDLIKDSFGRIQAIIIFNDRNEAYFESLTINMEKPRYGTIRIVEEDIEITEFTEDERKLKDLNDPVTSARKTHP